MALQTCAQPRATHWPAAAGHPPQGWPPCRWQMAAATPRAAAGPLVAPCLAHWNGTTTAGAAATACRRRRRCRRCHSCSPRSVPAAQMRSGPPLCATQWVLEPWGGAGALLAQRKLGRATGCPPPAAPKLVQVLQCCTAWSFGCWGPCMASSAAILAGLRPSLACRCPAKFREFCNLRALTFHRRTAR